MDELLKAAEDDVAVSSEQLLRLRKSLQNRVKACRSCGKNNGYNLTRCNACSASLTEIPVTYTINVFSSFMYGIERCEKFPFTISVRYESSKCLVFDDMCQVAPCHLCAIPTDVYVPDVRYLFEDPERGLGMLRRLHNAAIGVVVDGFLANKAWRSKMFRDSADMSDDDFKKHVISGFNFPPSQYQLHLQMMLPPFMPFHYLMYLKGNHYTKLRFFPFEFIQQSLEALLQRGRHIPAAREMSASSLIEAVYSISGVDYDAVYSKCYTRYGDSHRKLANWKAEDFSTSIKADECEDEECKTAIQRDAGILKNYGKGGLRYYAYAKLPGEVKYW